MAANLKHLPQQLKLEENPVQNWQIFKQRWTAYTVLSNFDEQALIKQKAILINCLSDEAMQVYIIVSKLKKIQPYKIFSNSSKIILLVRQMIHMKDSNSIKEVKMRKKILIRF